MPENLLKERLQQKCFPVKMKKYKKKTNKKIWKRKNVKKVLCLVQIDIIFAYFNIFLIEFSSQIKGI